MNDAFCFYPFIQMLLDPDGTIRPCCWMQKYVLGNIKDKPLIEIWNDAPIQKLREEFLKGRPTTCASQMKNLGCHKTSIRPYTGSVPVEVIQKDLPRRLDLRLNGKCNLQCIMCNVWEEPNGTYDESGFWSDGKRTLFPFLEELVVLGGEPFVQRDTYRLIDEVTAVNSKCRWGFITNGQYELSPKILDALDKIDIRYIQVSLDSVVPETYRKIRKGGELDRALKTLQGYIHLSQSREASGRGFLVSVAFCVQKSNYHEIPKFMQFARPLGLEVGMQFVSHPFSESLLSLPRKKRSQILAELTEVQKGMNISQLSSVISTLRDSLEA